jgi:hypothetical protein
MNQIAPVTGFDDAIRTRMPPADQRQLEALG